MATDQTTNWTKAPSSALRLEDVRVERLEVVTKGASNALPGEPPAVHAAFSFMKHRTVKNAYKVGLRLRVLWPKDAYFKRALVHLSASFALPPDMAPEEAGRYYPMLVSLQVVGLARIALFNATSLSPLGGFTLPFLDISEAVKREFLPPPPGQENREE